MAGIVDYIALVIAFFALGTAIWSVTVASKSLKLSTFSALLKEISDEEARRDRHLVYKIQSGKKEHIKELIESMWKDDISHRADLGRAAERTIARLDRVGFFLLGKGHKLRTDTPEWLWQLVKDMWEKLGSWVEYRQTCEEGGFYHKGYGLYFKRLEDYRKEHSL